VAALIAEAEQLTASADLDAGKADAFHAKYTALIEKISSTDPSINWKVFEDTCADYSMLTEKSAHWQIRILRTAERKHPPDGYSRPPYRSNTRLHPDSWRRIAS